MNPTWGRDITIGLPESDYAAVTRPADEEEISSIRTRIV
jgi:hypothetical protein